MIWDLNTNGTYDAGEFFDDRVFNVANELTARDIDNNGGAADYDLVYDGNGNLTDDGKLYDYIYDAWNRLVEINEDGTSNPVAAYEYNALGWRITAIHDVDNDDSLGNNITEHNVYDQSWRQVAMYQDSDTAATTTWVHHNAGLNGRGGSSKIDEVILRDRDTTANGTLDERRYYCQNFRGDIVVTLKDDDTQVERIVYTPYGQAIGMPAADLDMVGDHDQANDAVIDAEPVWTVLGDVNLDGTVDSTDADDANSPEIALGRNVLSHADNNNRRGYNGYTNDGIIDELNHIRARAYDNQQGRWLQRDNGGGYVDGFNLYGYVRGNPIQLFDPRGLAACGAGLGDGSGCGGSGGNEHCEDFCEAKCRPFIQTWLYEPCIIGCEDYCLREQGTPPGEFDPTESLLDCFDVCDAHFPKERFPVFYLYCTIGCFLAHDPTTTWPILPPGGRVDCQAECEVIAREKHFRETIRLQGELQRIQEGCDQGRWHPQIPCEEILADARHRSQQMHDQIEAETDICKDDCDDDLRRPINPPPPPTNPIADTSSQI